MDKTVTQIMEQVKNDICDNYCKYPEWSKKFFKDTDKADEFLLNEICLDCPLKRL